MRTFSYPDTGTWRERGRAHGEAFAGEIRSLAELRVYLTRTVGRFASDDEVLEAARAHLPVLRSFDADLHDELIGIAEGAGTSPESIVVLNHYTDLRDLGGRSGADDVIGGDGCTALWARTESGPVLAQTWDMHASAMPFVIMLRVPRAAGVPAAWLLSLTGCLGMAGLAATGVAVAINNLHSTDAQVGVVWSALVRRALRAADAVAARDVICTAPVASGHHYLVADASEVFGIETSGTRREVVFAGEGDLYVHTNHCLASAVAANSRVPEGSTTFDRYRAAEAEATANPLGGAEDAFVLLGSEEGYPRSVCTNLSNAERPHAAATCGALSIDLSERRVLACAGFPHGAEPSLFSLPKELQ